MLGVNNNRVWPYRSQIKATSQVISAISVFHILKFQMGHVTFQLQAVLLTIYSLTNAVRTFDKFQGD